MRISFTVPGRAVPMERPRVTRSGRKTYTPKRSAEYRELVQIYAKAAMRGREPLKRDVFCDIYITLPIPKTWGETKKKQAASGLIRPIWRRSGDADNYAKAIMDALTGICWIDDSQVVHLGVTKSYGKSAKACVFVESLTED